MVRVEYDIGQASEPA